LSILSITFGLILDFELIQVSNYTVVQGLFGWAFGFFSLSITIYSLIMRLTKSTILSVYIQKYVKIKSITIIFSTSFCFEVFLLFIYMTNTIFITILGQLLLFVIPLMLLIGLINFKVILPLLKGTTTKESIFFFEKYAEIVKDKFKKGFKIHYSKAERDLKIHDLDVRKRIPNEKTRYFMKRFQLSVFAKEFNDLFEEINKDAINIMFEVNDLSKYANPDIFKDLGRIASPPYISYDFIQKNTVIKLNLGLSESNEYDKCILDFIEGFIIESLESPYLEGIMAYEIEKLTDVIRKIGIKARPTQTNKDTSLYDKIFEVYQKISVKIAFLITGDKYKTSDPLQRIIEKFGSMEISFNSSNKVVQGVQLYRIRELIKLDIPLQLKLNLFKQLKEVLNRIKDVSLSGPYFFSIFQEVFPAILQIKYLENKWYNPSKIKEGDIRIENERKIFTRNALLFGNQYNTGLSRWLDETVGYLFFLYKAYIKKLEQKSTYNPYIEQLNRIFIDFVYFLNTLKSTEKFNAELFVNKIIEKIIEKMSNLGENLLRNQKSNLDFTYLLSPFIIISEMIINKDKESKALNIIKNNLQKDFIFISVIGINIIHKYAKKNEFIKLDNQECINKFSLLESTYLTKKEFPSEYGIGNEFFRETIESRQGSWKELGFAIGYHIGEILAIFSNGQPAMDYFAAFKENKQD